MIGEKIKEIRTKNNLTQKDLADKLYVTAQAVSRWENNEVEPSISTITEIAKIFNVSVDELVGNDEKTEPLKKEEVTPAVTESTKQVLTICERCNKPLYASEEIYRYSNVIHHRSGRKLRSETVSHILCKECNDKRLEEERKAKEEAEAARISKIKKRRIIAYIVGGILLAVLAGIGIYNMVIENTVAGVCFIAAGVFAYTLSGCLIMDNTFLPEMFYEICSWGFVKMPGVIFQFSLDGIIAGIILKGILAVLGFLLALATVVLSFIISGALSIFVYPFALVRSYHGRGE